MHEHFRNFSIQTILPIKCSVKKLRKINNYSASKHFKILTELLKKSNNNVKYLRMLVYLNPSEVGFAAQVAGFGVLVSPR